MLRNILIPVVLGATLIAFGCGGSAPATNKPANANANANTATTNNVVNAPASSANPTAPPANATPPAQSPTPTPANSSTKDVKKLAKPTATSASGIPDADAMRKTMGQPEMKPMQANNNSSMMMKKKPTPEKP